MLIDTRDTTLSSFVVVQRKIFRGMFAGQEISILTRIKRALRTGEKIPKITANLPSRAQIVWIFPERISLRINTQVFRLHLHDLFEVRMIPIAVSRVLISATPDRIDKFALRVERFARHSFEVLIAQQGLVDAVINDIPIKKLLHGTPPAILVVVVSAQFLLQFLSGHERQSRPAVRVKWRLPGD